MNQNFEIHLNDACRVKLSESGALTLSKSREHIGEQDYHVDYIETPLWKLFSIFGPSMCLASPAPFVGAIKFGNFSTVDEIEKVPDPTELRWFVVPMSFDKDGNGPVNGDDVVETQYEIWDENSSTVCTCSKLTDADRIVGMHNSTINRKLKQKK